MNPRCWKAPPRPASGLPTDQMYSGADRVFRAVLGHSPTLDTIATVKLAGFSGALDERVDINIPPIVALKPLRQTRVLCRAEFEIAPTARRKLRKGLQDSAFLIFSDRMNHRALQGSSRSRAVSPRRTSSWWRVPSWWALQPGASGGAKPAACKCASFSAQSASTHLRRASRSPSGGGSARVCTTHCGQRPQRKSQNPGAPPG